MRLYIDANPIIYAFEGEPALKEAALAWLRHARFDPAITLLTSRLTRLEVRCKPISSGNLELLDRYDRLLESPAIETVSLTDSILEAATHSCARGRPGRPTPSTSPPPSKPAATRSSRRIGP